MSSFVDSRHQELSQEEILAIAAKETGGGYSVEQVKASLSAEAYEMGAIMMREGNTIFVVHQDKEKPHIAVFRALNADTIKNFTQNCVVFAKAMGMAGFRYMVTQFKEESLLNIFEYVRRHQPFPNMGYAVNKTTDGGYQVTVNLGDIPPKGSLPFKEPVPVAGGL
jgi:hypothetical protein